MRYNEYLATLFASMLISIILAIFFWSRRPAPGATAMAGLSGAVLIWSLGYIVEITATSLSGFQLADDIEYVGTVSIPVLWFIFTTQYSRYNNWLTRYRSLLIIIPLITLLLVWTDDLHGWMWYNPRIQIFGEFLVHIKTYGPWFWVHTAYSYILILLGIAILGRLLFQTRNLYRRQITVLLIGIALPMIWNTIFIFKAAPTYYIDMTPPAFVVSGIIVAFGIFRFGILKIVPVAFGTVVENMRDGIIIFDQQNHVLEINRAGSDILGKSEADLIGKPASVILDKFPVLLTLTLDNGKLPAEAVINKGENQLYYELSLTLLYDRKQNLIGKVLILHNLTERKKMEESLKDYARRITQVQEEERKRIAYELHDDTAQYLSILKMQIGSLLQSGKIQSPEIMDKLQFLEKDADRAFQDVRRYSHELRPGILEYQGLLAALEQMAEDTNKLELLRVEVNSEGDDPGLAEDVKLGFFRIAQEAVNNARKHAKSSRVEIKLHFFETKVEMSVTDNGIGFDFAKTVARTSEKGSMGLMSMQERANLIGAKLTIDSKAGRGTTVTVELAL
jgi:PAS domain S-box-containing protein